MKKFKIFLISLIMLAVLLQSLCARFYEVGNDVGSRILTDEELSVSSSSTNLFEPGQPQETDGIPSPSRFQKLQRESSSLKTRRRRNAVQKKVESASENDARQFLQLFGHTKEQLDLTIAIAELFTASENKNCSNGDHNKIQVKQGKEEITAKTTECHHHCHCTCNCNILDNFTVIEPESEPEPVSVSQTTVFKKATQQPSSHPRLVELFEVWLSSTVKPLEIDKSLVFKTDNSLEAPHSEEYEQKLTNATIPIRTPTAMEVASELSKVPITHVLQPNKRKCYLDMVGKPVLHGHTNFLDDGSWFRDTAPADAEAAKRRWLLKSSIGTILKEYVDEETLRHFKPSVVYYFNHARIAGTGSVIYNGHLYYHLLGTKYIIKYSLDEAAEKLRRYIRDLVADPDTRARVNDCPKGPYGNHGPRRSWCPESGSLFLYGLVNNSVDFAVDENGLWVLYVAMDASDPDKSVEPVLVVSKLDSENLESIHGWRITSRDPSAFANTFIMCGVLYGLDSGIKQAGNIAFALDLYENRELPLFNVPWLNPYGKTTMLDYNPVDRRLYFYESGRLLTAAIRTISILAGRRQQH